MTDYIEKTDICERCEVQYKGFMSKAVLEVDQVAATRRRELYICDNCQQELLEFFSKKEPVT